MTASIQGLVITLSLSAHADDGNVGSLGSLSTHQVRGWAEALSPALLECVGGEPSAVHAEMVLHGDGSMTDVLVSGLDDLACGAAALEKAGGLLHIGAPTAVGFTVLTSDGQMGTPIDVTVRAPTPDPIFLHVPMGESSGMWERLRQELGLSEVRTSPGLKYER